MSGLNIVKHDGFDDREIGCGHCGSEVWPCPTLEALDGDA